MPRRLLRMYDSASGTWQSVCPMSTSTRPILRAAVMALLVFLHLNGIEKLPAPHGLEVVTLQVAGGELSKDALTQWLRAQIGKRK